MSPERLRLGFMAVVLFLPVLGSAKAKVVVRTTTARPAVSPAPVPAQAQVPAAALTALWLPFDGTWAVQRETKGKSDADRTSLRFQKVDAQGSPRYTKSGSRGGNAAYYAWSAPVYAPFEGDVLDVENGIRDNAEPGEVNRRKPLGNHVLLRHPDGDFTLLAHLRKGTITVRKGDHVRCGELIGQCGNSGDIPSPQLRLIQMSTVAPRMPVAPVFTLYATGAAPVMQSLVVVGSPRAGEYVEPREAGLYVAPRAGSYVPRPWQTSGAATGTARPAPRPTTTNAGPTTYSAPISLPVTKENVSGPGSAGPDHPAPGNLRGRPAPQPIPRLVAPVVPPAPTPVATPPATPVATPPATPVATPPATPVATPPATPVATPPATPVVAPPVAPAGNDAEEERGGKPRAEARDDRNGQHKGRGADRDGDGKRDVDQDNGKDSRQGGRSEETMPPTPEPTPQAGEGKSAKDKDKDKDKDKNLDKQDESSSLTSDSTDDDTAAGAKPGKSKNKKKKD